MEEKKYPKKPRKPQPKIGSLVVAFDWRGFKTAQERKRREADEAKHDSEYVRSIKASRIRFHAIKPSSFPMYDYVVGKNSVNEYRYLGNINEGTIGVVIKGNGNRDLYIAFGGMVGWIDALNVAPIEWVEDLKRREPEWFKPSDPITVT